MTAYTTKVLTSQSELDSVAEEWKRVRLTQVRPSIEQHPDWIAFEVQARSDWSTAAIALHAGGELVGFAPFLLRPWKWDCRLAYKKVVSFPVRMADLCGPTFIAPDDRAAWEAMFGALAKGDLPYDLVYLEDLPTASPLWAIIQESKTDGLWRFVPTKPRTHWLVKIASTFDEYLTKFPSKRRSKLRNENKRIDKNLKEPTRLERVTAPEQVAGLLAHVKHVSGVSWQGTRLQQVVNDDDAERRKYEARAKSGWLRAYLLLSGDKCVAFVLGAQVDGVFYYEQIGYDPEWTTFRPGAVLLYRILADLHAHDPPEFVDFGTGDAPYKQFWGNENYEAVDLYLLRRSVYMGVARSVQWSLGAVESAARQSIDRLGVRSKVLQFLKRGNAARPGRPDAAAADEDATET